MRGSSTQEGVALVTGAASGIGYAVAAALSRQGRCVVLTDRDGERLSNAVSELTREALAEVFAFPLDVREPEQVEQVTSEVERSIGPVHWLALVAGVLHMGTALEVSEQGIRDSLLTNAEGTFRMARAVVRQMVPRRRGAVVSVASNAARTPRVDMAAYAASKAAAAMFIKCLGLEVAQHGIRCNIVSPGSTDTPMQRSLWRDETGPARVIQEDLTRHRLGIPLGRIAAASDVADAGPLLAVGAGSSRDLARGYGRRWRHLLIVPALCESPLRTRICVEASHG